MYNEYLDDINNRYKTAFKTVKDNNVNAGMKANAYYTLYEYHYYGKGMAEKNTRIALACLIEAAKLGHAQACFVLVKDFAKSLQISKSDLMQYIQVVLQHIDDPSFNTIAYSQNLMGRNIRALQSILSPQPETAPILNAYNQQSRNSRFLSEEQLFDALHPGLSESLRNDWRND